MQSHLAFPQCYVGPAYVTQMSALPSLLLIRLLLLVLFSLPKRIVLERNALLTEEFVEQTEGQVFIMHPSKHFYYSKANIFIIPKLLGCILKGVSLPFLFPGFYFSQILLESSRCLSLVPCWKFCFLLAATPDLYPLFHVYTYVDNCKSTSSYYDAPWCR